MQSGRKAVDCTDVGAIPQIKNSGGLVVRKRLGVPYHLEIINLGSTFAKSGFSYSYFPKNGYNFAEAPQTLKSDFQSLIRYTPHLAPNAIVLVVVCPFGFARYAYEKPPNPIHRKLLVTCKKLVKRAICSCPGARGAHLQETPQQCAQRVANSRIAGWKAEFHLENVTEPRPTEEMQRTFQQTVDVLRQMLQFCTEHGLRPVILNMPAAPAEYTQFSPSFLQTFYYDNLQAANVVGAPVLDYFGDHRFDDVSLYSNCADCLNDAGRKIFAEVLIEDLCRLGMWDT